MILDKQSDKVQQLPAAKGAGGRGEALEFFQDYCLQFIEVRGGPHEVFRPREGGADQDQVFPCRVVSSSS